MVAKKVWMSSFMVLIEIRCRASVLRSVLGVLMRKKVSSIVSLN